MEIRKHDGFVITDPGIYAGIDIDAYHQNPFLCDKPSISSSGIRALIDRPSLYWAYSPYNAKRFERESSAELDFGKAAHHLLLEGDEGFAEKFVVSPFDSFRSKEAREWRDGTVASGKTIVTQTDLDKISAIRDSLNRHPIIRGGIMSGQVEMSMFCRVDDWLWLRARPDAIPAHSGDFADLKTTTSVRYEDLERSIYKFGYHIQAAMIRKVARSVMGDDWKFGGFAFVFVEKSPPYDVRILQLRDDAIDLGERQINEGLRMMQACIKRWEWPGEEGFSPGVGYVGIPEWGASRIRTDLDMRERENLG